MCKGTEVGADPAIGRHKRRFICLERRKQEGKYYRIRVVMRASLDPRGSRRPEISIHPFSVILGQGVPCDFYLIQAYKTRRAGGQGG